MIIAHRGASADAPENTLAAFKKALDINVHCIELDVRLSQDGIPVVFHDENLSRITGVKHAPSIHELPLSALKLVDAGNKFGSQFAGELIPTLKEVLELPWKATGLMIEIKECPQNATEVVQAVLECLRTAKCLPPFLVIGSFSIETYEATYNVKDKLLKLNTSIEIIGIIEKIEMIQPFVDRGVDMVALWYKLITPDLMKFLKERNVNVWSFTIDDEKIAQVLKSMGVKGIISNTPAIMLKKLPS